MMLPVLFLIDPAYCRGPRVLNNGAAACMGCSRGCITRNAAFGTDSQCMDVMWYNLPVPPWKRTEATDRLKAADIIQKYGINAFDAAFGGGSAVVIPGQVIQPATPDATSAGWYVKRLYDMGVIGPRARRLIPTLCRWICMIKQNSSKSLQWQ
jgi:hypothetical protein